MKHSNSNNNNNNDKNKIILIAENFAVIKASTILPWLVLLIFYSEGHDF
jgi:hypothetical protein